MNASDDPNTIDHEALKNMIRDHLTPEAVATIIAFLQPAALHKPASADARQALKEVEWFTDTLISMLGVDEYTRLMDELGL